jgi:heme/copper-type cytochrome/quinol oxidase subunit 2
VSDPFPPHAPGQVGPRYFAPAPGELRHPLDPDVRTSSKAGAVLFLGVVSVLMMLCVGGVVPAILALTIARGARAELRESQGFLTGDRMLRAGVVLSWLAIAVSTIVLVVLVVYALVVFGASSGPKFGSNVN